MASRSALVATLWLVTAAVPARADYLPARPISLWNDRLVVSGEVTLTTGLQDEGYFNAIDYSHDAFNLLTMSGSADFRIHDRVSVLGEVVDEIGLRAREFGTSDRHVIRAYALYVRVQPIAEHPFYVQAGRIPPVFGAFARQEYGSGNPLIGLPLAYHYPTVVRPDVVPPSVGEMVANRGEGWWVRYPRLSLQGEQGVPLTSARRWDTGVQVRWGDGPVDVAVALTNGSLSKPLTVDDNGGKQVSARVGWRPSAALSLGASLAKGEFVSDEARGALPVSTQNRGYRQDALGIDAEVSGGHVVLRGEVVASRWFTPFVDGEPTRRLGAMAGWIEGRVKLSPRWSVAARAERLGFSNFQSGIETPENPAGMAPYGMDGGSTGSPTSDASTGPDLSWDAPVTRIEAGVGYLLQRNVKLKAAYQYDWRDGGRVRREGHFAVQALYWF
jgi:hypothetical protein